MADPASILGTAVGVTSLGIQACQTLSQYYAHFRTFDDDISAVVKRLDSLSHILEVLEWLRPKVESPGSPVSSQLQQAVEACISGLSDLQEMAVKFGGLTVPATVQDKKQILKKRLLWPLRQETVAGMVSTLEGLQADVQLAVQLLDM
ncbi:hypothetical protein SVAN01_03246 [Stagonosporopsis vannaccii]|nr:hypothetical protein SVAN01_03246 [Stagonosporopsis vannaccii]